MASKKKKVAPKKPITVTSKKPTPKPTKTKPTKTKPPSIAVSTLSKLPPLSGKLRLAFRAAFSDEQCDAWGSKTKAATVLAEAQKVIPLLFKAVSVELPYSPRRLAFLCELVVLLEDEMAHTDASSNGLVGTRSAALALAAQAQRELERRLKLLVGGREALRAELEKVSPSNLQSPSDVQDALTATIDFALKLRRNEVMEALADDVGLDEARLNAAYSALEVLAGASDVALNQQSYEGDAPSVNRIEGRVLRELALAATVVALPKLASLGVVGS